MPTRRLPKALIGSLIWALPALAASSSSGGKDPSDTPAKFLECDIWGATLFALDLPPFSRKRFSTDEEGVRTPPSLTGPFPEVITQVWNNHLSVDPRDQNGAYHPYCLTADRAVYGMFAVIHSETEGTWFSLKEFDSLSKCKEEVFMDVYTERILPFPKTPLSRNCPFLGMGTSRDQIEKYLGPAHVKHGQSLYYLQLDTPEFRSSCRNWLDAADDSSCCYPAMSLTFSDGRMTEIAIQDGHGEGPPCDEQPNKEDFE